ncbi:uncharacterized protein METZ01_LOCUS82423 [marine metagenome]|uniref:Uncharacterized protein n=1 Tax=marine metagenome TaxID=408172 RepID=A0A381UN43_9ZZZZ
MQNLVGLHGRAEDCDFRGPEHHPPNQARHGGGPARAGPVVDFRRLNRFEHGSGAAGVGVEFPSEVLADLRLNGEQFVVDGKQVGRSVHLASLQ